MQLCLLHPLLLVTLFAHVSKGTVVRFVCLLNSLLVSLFVLQMTQLI